MWRFAAGVVSTLVLVAAGLFIWRAEADKRSLIPPVPLAQAEAPLSAADLAPPPVASEKTREEKRFARYDKDKNGAVAKDEYLAGRLKGFQKLDLNRDGRLSFDEYAVKGVQKFAAADRDRSGQLNAGEFATTRVVRKAKAKPKCAPAVIRQQPEEDEA